MASPRPPAAAKFEETLENAVDFLELMKDSAAKAPFVREIAVLRKRMHAALESQDRRKAAQLATAVQKDAAKMLDALSHASRLEIARRDWQELHAKAGSLLAQALVEIGKIDPPALRAPVQAEQGQLRAELDSAERAGELIKSNAAMQAVMPRIETLLKRLRGVADASSWVRSAYRPLLARVQASLQRVPGDRCRKTLLAELDFVQADADNAMARCDMRLIQACVLPLLQRIEKLAARIIAVSPALDRELARLAKLSTSAQPGMVAQLKRLVQTKAGDWPAGATVDDIERAMIAFEGEVAKLAAQFERATTAVRS